MGFEPISQQAIGTSPARFFHPMVAVNQVVSPWGYFGQYDWPGKVSRIDVGLVDRRIGLEIAYRHFFGGKISRAGLDKCEQLGDVELENPIGEQLVAIFFGAGGETVVDR